MPPFLWLETARICSSSMVSSPSPNPEPSPWRPSAPLWRCSGHCGSERVALGGRVEADRQITSTSIPDRASIRPAVGPPGTWSLQIPHEAPPAERLGVPFSPLAFVVGRCRTAVDRCWKSRQSLRCRHRSPHPRPCSAAARTPPPRSRHARRLLIPPPLIPLEPRKRLISDPLTTTFRHVSDIPIDAHTASTEGSKTLFFHVFLVLNAGSQRQMFTALVGSCHTGPNVLLPSPSPFLLSMRRRKEGRKGPRPGGDRRGFLSPPGRVQ